MLDKFCCFFFVFSSFLFVLYVCVFLASIVSWLNHCISADETETASLMVQVTLCKESRMYCQCHLDLSLHSRNVCLVCSSLSVQISSCRQCNWDTVQDCSGGFRVLKQVVRPHSVHVCGGGFRMLKQVVLPHSVHVCGGLFPLLEQVVRPHSVHVCGGGFRVLKQVVLPHSVHVCGGEFRVLRQVTVLAC